MIISKYYIYIASAFILTACDNKIEKEVLSKLDYELRSIKISNNILKEQISLSRKKADSITELNYVPKKTIKTHLNDSLSYLLDKTSVFKRIKNDYLINDYGFDFTIYDNCGYINEDLNFGLRELNATEKFIINFDRSSENIDNFFSENLNIITSILTLDFYKKSGMHITFEALIKAYEELAEDEFNTIYSVFSEIENEEIQYINSIASDEVINMLRKDIEYTDFDFTEDFHTGGYVESVGDKFGTINRLLYIYSFWGRRHKEGNKEAVYRALKKINSKMILGSK